jgi:hypothetical protein
MDVKINLQITPDQLYGIFVSEMIFVKSDLAMKLLIYYIDERPYV